MTHHIFKTLATIAMGAILLTAFQCGKGEDPEPLNPNCNARHSECLSHTDRGFKGIYSPDSASVVYDAANQRLHVTHHIFKTLATIAMGAILLTAFQCGKGEDPEPLNPNCNARHSECLSHTDRDSKGIYSPDSASVVYDAANQRLHVTHHNLAVNCGTAMMDGGIIVSAIRDGQTIDIYENEDESNPQADCMCDVDNEFGLYSIEPGTYTLVFHSCYPDPLSATFTF